MYLLINKMVIFTIKNVFSGNFSVINQLMVMQQGKIMQNKSMKRESKLKANPMIYKGRIIIFSNHLQSGYNRQDNDNVIFIWTLRFISNRFFLIFFDKKEYRPFSKLFAKHNFCEKIVAKKTMKGAFLT